MPDNDSLLKDAHHLVKESHALLMKMEKLLSDSPVEPERVEAALTKSYVCNVDNCGGGKCVHELTDERCPECGNRLVRNTRNNWMYCSSDDISCDYERDGK